MIEIGSNCLGRTKLPRVELVAHGNYENHYHVRELFFFVRFVDLHNVIYCYTGDIHEHHEFCLLYLCVD